LLLLLDAQTHDDGQAGVLTDPSRIVVGDALLQPEDLGAASDRLFGDLGRAEIRRRSVERALSLLLSFL